MGKAKHQRAATLNRAGEVRPPSFRHWLRGQRDRDDQVGLFARDVLSSHGDLPSNELQDYRSKLRGDGATDAQLKVLEQAWREYTTVMKVSL